MLFHKRGQLFRHRVAIFTCHGDSIDAFLPYARTIFPLVLSLPSLLEQISYFLLFGLRTLDLLDVAEGRILGRGGQLHLELGENEVDACARAEAAYTADASRTADSTDTLTHTSPIS